MKKVIFCLAVLFLLGEAAPATCRVRCRVGDDICELFVRDVLAAIKRNDPYPWVESLDDGELAWSAIEQMVECIRISKKRYENRHFIGDPEGDLLEGIVRLQKLFTQRLMSLIDDDELGFTFKRELVIGPLWSMVHVASCVAVPLNLPPDQDFIWKKRLAVDFLETLEMLLPHFVNITDSKLGKESGGKLTLSDTEASVRWTLDKVVEVLKCLKEQSHWQVSDLLKRAVGSLNILIPQAVAVIIKTKNRDNSEAIAESALGALIHLTECLGAQPVGKVKDVIKDVVDLAEKLISKELKILEKITQEFPEPISVTGSYAADHRGVFTAGALGSLVKALCQQEAGEWFGTLVSLYEKLVSCVLLDGLADRVSIHRDTVDALEPARKLREYVEKLRTLKPACPLPDARVVRGKSVRGRDLLNAPRRCGGGVGKSRRGRR